MFLILISSSFESWLENWGRDYVAFSIFLFLVVWAIISLFIGFFFGGSYPRQKLQDRIHDLIQNLENREKQMFRAQALLRENIKNSVQKNRRNWEAKLEAAQLRWEKKKKVLAASYQELLAAEKEAEEVAEKEIVHLIQAVHPALQNVKRLRLAEEILEKIEAQAVLAEKNNLEEKVRIRKQFVPYRAALKKINAKLQDKMKAYKLSQEERYQEFRDRIQADYEEEQKIKALYSEAYANIWQKEERFHQKSLALWSPEALRQIDLDIDRIKKLKKELAEW